MAWKKLNPPLLEALESLNYETPLAFQKKIISRIKSGANIFGIGPEGCGKTTALIIGTLQRLDSQAFEDAPRAMIFVKDNQAAEALEKAFVEFTRHIDLRIFTAYDGPDIEKQKIAIYEGTDILIGTPHRLNRLFLISGIDVNQLKLFIVEDAEFLSKSQDFNNLIEVSNHISKCQFLVFAAEFHPRLERLQELFMEHSELVEVVDSETD